MKSLALFIEESLKAMGVPEPAKRIWQAAQDSPESAEKVFVALLKTTKGVPHTDRVHMLSGCILAYAMIRAESPRLEEIMNKVAAHYRGEHDAKNHPRA